MSRVPYSSDPPLSDAVVVEKEVNRWEVPENDDRLGTEVLAFPTSRVTKAKNRPEL